MYCIRCGKYLKDGTKYCIYCGAATACADSMNPIDWNIKKKQSSDDDIFDISIPDDFIGSSEDDADELEAELPVPHEAEDESYTQAVSQADIKAAMKAFDTAQSEEDADKTEKIDFDIAVPDDFIGSSEDDADELEAELPVPHEAEDESYTQAVSQADIKAAMKAFDTAQSEEDADKTEKIDFDIAVPDDFIGSSEDDADELEAELPVPHEAEDESYTQAVSQADIKAAIKAFDTAQSEEKILTPDEAGDESYTQAVSKADIKAAMKAAEQEEKTTKEAELHTSHTEHKTDVQDIPDIPIPMEFRNAGESAPEPVFRRDTPPLPVAKYEDDDEEDEEREPWVSGRGIALVAVLVILFFAIAVGSFVLVMRGSWLPDNQDAGSGEVQTQVGFWGAGDNSDSAD